LSDVAKIKKLTIFENSKHKIKKTTIMEDLKSKIASLEKGIQSKVTPAPMKKKMEEQLAKLNAELAQKEKIEKEKSVAKGIEKTSKPEKKEDKTPSTKKASPTKKESKSKEKDEDHVTCEDLLKEYEERLKKHNKAAKKYATTSISEKIGNNMASAVAKALDNVSAEDLKKSPKKYIEKFETVQKEAKAFLGKLKSILGEDFDKEDILAPLEEVIQKHIDNIKTKIKK
jgi:hypothetical protein